MKLNLAVLLMFCLTPLASVALPDDHLLQQIQQCRQVQQDSQRLACFDQIQLQALSAPVSLPPPASMPVAAVPKAPENSALPQAVPPVTPAAATSDAEFGAEKLKKAEPEQAEEISSTITAVETNTLKKLTITLENGQQWSQIGSEYIRIKAGDTATIRRAALGTFLLGTDKVTKTIRVRRVK